MNRRRVTYMPPGPRHRARPSVPDLVVRWGVAVIIGTCIAVLVVVVGGAL